MKRVKVSGQSGLFGLVATIVLIASSGASAEQAVSDISAEDMSKIKWLFVAKTTGGSFDGEVITFHDVPPALIFSDRPYRETAHMGLTELLPIVEQGDDNFIVNPPNAVLTTFREGEIPTEATVVMTNASFDGSTFTFTAEILDGTVPETFGPASLFVDHHHHHPVATVAVVGAVANNNNDPDVVYVTPPPAAPVAAPAPAPVAAPASAQDQLTQVKSLYDQGLITEDEYTQKRADILDSM